MMKKCSPFMLSLLVAFMLFLQPLAAQAAPNKTVTKEYLSDGSYYETVLETEVQTRSYVRGAKKTVTYKNADGKSIWYLTVTADFYFDGSTSRCTSSSVSAGSYTSTHKILSKTSGRSGNSGWAKATVGTYMGGVHVTDVTRTIYIYCDKNGDVS